MFVVPRVFTVLNHLENIGKRMAVLNQPPKATFHELDFNHHDSPKINKLGYKIGSTHQKITGSSAVSQSENIRLRVLNK